MRAWLKRLRLLIAMSLLVLWILPVGAADEEPQYGGVMKVAIQGDPPSLDMHQESTFLVMIPFGNVYNTLIKFHPHRHNDIVGDLAESWTSSEDGLTHTFKLRKGVKFHDGSDFTSADAKASWDKICFPPKGTISARRSIYQMVDKIEAPDPDTIVFKLHYPAASFIPLMALPYNLIYSKAKLDADPNWYKKNAMGTGPFKLKQIRRGSFIEMERNENYWKKGMPYLDGIKYFMIKDTSARAKSVRTGRTDVELRGFPPAEVEAMRKQMGDKLTVAYPRINLQWGVAFNVTNQENIAEAKRLLAEAGYPNGFKTVLSNRSVKLPYIDFGVYLTTAWKKIGVEAEHKLKESATWRKDNRAHNFAINVDPMGNPSRDPDAMLQTFITNGTGNDGLISDPEVDKLFEQQKVELDEQKRIELVREAQRKILDNMYWMPGLWWKRIETRSFRIKNYKPMHHHHMNRRMEDVWLAKQ